MKAMKIRPHPFWRVLCWVRGHAWPADARPEGVTGGTPYRMCWRCLHTEAVRADTKGEDT